VTVSASRIDTVLQVRPPELPAAAACEIGRSAFGVEAADAQSLGSERDQAFLLTDAAGSPTAVLKVSNAAEDPARLDMEALAAFHAFRHDPGLTIALPRRAAYARDDSRARGDGAPARLRARWERDGTAYWARAYNVLPGRARLDPITLSDEAVTAWGETIARLGRALRGFIHPKAIRRLPWDIHHAASARPMIASIGDQAAQAAVTAALDRFEAAVAPRWGLLRAQVIHGDLTTDNALADDDGLITGIVDFGDMTHTALAADLASVLDSLAAGRDSEEMFRVARLIIDGYERVMPLEPIERELIGELWAARAAVTVSIGSWRAAAGLEEPVFAQRYTASSLAVIESLLTAGWDRAARMLGSVPCSHAVPTRAGTGPGRVAALGARRDAAFGPAMEPLSYAEPIEMASAEGTWMTDADGRRYLDMYNNVPCVGHGHPRVTAAVAAQWRVLNTNLRYLHASAVELAERLIATCPPALDTVLFVNSGSEANDLAWRLARHHTQNTGGLCTQFAYHGMTAATADLSPEVLPGALPPPHVQTWAPPDTYRGLHLDPGTFGAALSALAARGHSPAAVILDGVLLSDGVYDLDADYARELVRQTHGAGGLWIADEVQGGHGRTGDAMWSFERFGIVPDFVTLGKPMGNGQPVGAVITRRELAERFARDTVFFSTFGGNQVSMAAAHAVLDVLADERVLPRTRAAGEALRAAVRAATDSDTRVGDVRGVGLANAIEIVTDRESKRPDPVTAAAVKDALRRRSVLVGTTGRAGNVIKVRPPLAFTASLVPIFLRALSESLRDSRLSAA
jgi:4-aminobutyrate aminotransferase-like enzyme/Ser/Thr protein kinase RdoA (MazF antagonist)